MKKRFTLLATAIVLGLSWSLLAQQQPSGEAPSTTKNIEAEPRTSSAPTSLTAGDLEGWLDGYMLASLEPSEIAGAVVSVVKDGQILLSKGYGYADIETKEPMDPARTLVRVGSTSKPFTWIAAMQMVEQGKLDLDQDINVYLDVKIPERDGGPVTMNHLMTHRGGFEEGLKEILLTDPAEFLTTEEYLKKHPRPRMFPAGDVPAYSNYGTALAGYIVERLSGEPFDDYIERHIFAPLKMERSTFRQPIPDRFKGDVSKGYMSTNEPPRHFELITTAPAGSLSSTANDMANFMIANLQNGQFEGHQILRPETAEFMYSPSVELPQGFTTMAHGFYHASENGRRVLGHGGDTIVFHTDMNFLPEEGVGIFVSFNSRGARDTVYGIRSRLFEKFMDRYFPAPDEKPLPPAIAGAADHAKELAGKYRSSRRIDSAFLRLLYMFQQNTVTANEDGTISLESQQGKKFREIAPNLWQDEESDHTLYTAAVNGRMTIADSRNPVSVQQAVPAAQNAAINTFIFIGSIIVIVLVLVAWPVNWWYRRWYNQPQTLSGKPLLAHQLTRFLILGNFAYFYGWYMAMQPILQSRIEDFSPALDGLLRTLQIGALIPLTGAGIAIWNAWLTINSDRHWTIKAVSALLAAAMIGIVWLAWAGNLISFSLEY